MGDAAGGPGRTARLRNWAPLLGRRAQGEHRAASPLEALQCYASDPSPLELQLPSSGTERESSATAFGVSWDSVAPLFRDTWQGRDHAWQVLVALEPLITRVAAREFRRAAAGRADRVASEQHTSADELLSDLLVHLLDVSLRDGGMSRPAGAPANPADATGWLVTWLRSRCSDVLRKAWRLEGKQDALELDRPGGPSVPADDGSVRLELAHMLGVVESGSISPNYVLACLCLRAPELLRRVHVERAASSLARQVDETWERLQDWRTKAVDPADDDARRELAWILLSVDPHSALAWRAADCDACQRGRDLLRKWEARFQAALIRARTEGGWG
jgi:hypothetical protein